MRWIEELKLSIHGNEWKPLVNGCDVVRTNVQAGNDTRCHLTVCS